MRRWEGVNTQIQLFLIPMIRIWPTCHSLGILLTDSVPANVRSLSTEPLPAHPFHCPYPGSSIDPKRPWLYLWEVMTMALPDSRALATVSQSRRRATGSMPVDGSSRKMTVGSPSRAMPVLSFRLLPPLGAEEGQERAKLIISMTYLGPNR